ncbi:uncharacterized protein LOC141855202 [Brevipalpus obovatus]|uniref:uncharacterized protein LOC141855202 n=1 Tax=Brevipalpus obovatus TaxID=246614 RepID=UPI003D9F472F
MGLSEKSKNFMLISSLMIVTCYAISVKDLLKCKGAGPVPMIDSVVLVNCTEEPCFFGKTNGLSFQFIVTPRRPASTVDIDITAEDMDKKPYEIEAKQRTSCANSYCQLEPKVPRCFSAVVRRKKQPVKDTNDMYRFMVKFRDQNGHLIACSKFLLGTYIRYGKSYKPNYDYKPVAVNYDYADSYKPSYAQVGVEHGSYGYGGYQPSYGNLKVGEDEAIPDIVDANTLNQAGGSEAEGLMHEEVPRIEVDEEDIDEEILPYDDFAYQRHMVFGGKQDNKEVNGTKLV